MQTAKATVVKSEIERLQTRIENCTRRKNKRKFRVRHRGVIKVIDVKDILKAKTKAANYKWILRHKGKLILLNKGLRSKALSIYMT
jgi:uncharacterized membrane protein